MPANKRHLGSRMQRISKTLAGIVGGYLIAMAFHLAIGIFWGSSPGWIQTTTYSSFAVWIAAIIVALLFKKAWQVWAIYGSIIVSCSVLIYLFR
ncbi:hypothetical protein [Fodinibius salsisoli]|uniref:Iron uptake protein n=1 Tax=Fodinibius salsisoli TaxID=2820877 RepID=A0ABT3PJT3_9BACT|nr:hypothetical protein [Fodinibius salsisoli]MCW9705444.1 hypothetical protein [Fodinibius salsisoli]